MREACQALLFYGDGSWGQARGCRPSQYAALRHYLAGQFHTVSVREYATSQTCPRCFATYQKTRPNDAHGAAEHRLRRCTQCALKYHKDASAAYLMLLVGLGHLLRIPRHRSLTRARTTSAASSTINTASTTNTTSAAITTATSAAVATSATAAARPPKSKRR